ncbi:MAG TPA: pyrroloquinoline quinone biosynthesis protein PqqE [Planosporangium sp.]|jgi:pyrroloquinoline quinone biosynthesis protein E|nr:pyrroloquinoline quinone biosynthesis protein PqqE [Planosporangium sp.]
MTTPAPLGMLAELTHACPLHCAYCSNPLTLVSRTDELSTAEWVSVFAAAAGLGVAQVHLSGGEPLQRRDLPELAAACREHGLYTNLITSGVGLDAERLAALPVDHVQISVQDADQEGAARISHTRTWQHKLEAARAVKASGRPLTINVVLHRQNLDRIEALVALAERMGADRLELAHTQYYGWARRNLDWLLPTAAQVRAANAVALAATSRLAGRMEIAYVSPDLHTATPKPCMGGWGHRQLTVTPNGDVLPCPVANLLPGLPVENVRDRPLHAIWYESESFNRFRGTEWMSEPCRSCPRRDIDFGGCRCQAYQFTGDAGVTDPACRYSPHRPLVEAVLAGGERIARSGDAGAAPPAYRPHPPTT